VSEHARDLLGAYALGVLDANERAAVRAHLDGCERCRSEAGDLRRMEAALGEIPPEAFLDGPPPDGDVVLRRTLQEVRGERARHDRRRRAGWAAVAVVIGIAAIGDGVVIGRATAPAAASPSTAPSTRVGTAADAETGVTMTVAIQPAAGWVRLRAAIGGVPAGEQCRLYVVARDGSRQQAASWLSAGAGVTLDGSALMAPADVAAVQVETLAGEILVVAPI